MCARVFSVHYGASSFSCVSAWHVCGNLRERESETERERERDRERELVCITSYGLYDHEMFPARERKGATVYISCISD